MCASEGSLSVPTGTIVSPLSDVLGAWAMAEHPDSQFKNYIMEGYTGVSALAPITVSTAVCLHTRQPSVRLLWAKSIWRRVQLGKGGGSSTNR